MFINTTRSTFSGNASLYFRARGVVREAFFYNALLQEVEELFVYGKVTKTLAGEVFSCNALLKQLGESRNYGKAANAFAWEAF